MSVAATLAAFLPRCRRLSRRDMVAAVIAVMAMLPYLRPREHYAWWVGSVAHVAAAVGAFRIALRFRRARHCPHCDPQQRARRNGCPHGYRPPPFPQTRMWFAATYLIASVVLVARVFWMTISGVDL